MTNVVTKPLPHKVGNAAIASGELKTVVMQFMENFVALGGQLSDVQSAVRELQRGGVGGGGGGSTDIDDIETYVGRAESAATTATSAKNAAVSAKNDAVSAKNDATSAKTDALSAKNDAVSAKNDAVSAKNDAVSASGTATDAASEAQGYASAASSAATRAETAASSAEWSVEFMLMGANLANRVYRRFYLDDIVPDTSKNYDIEVVFTNNQQGSTRTCSLYTSDWVSSTTSPDNSTYFRVNLDKATDNNPKGAINLTLSGSKWFRIAAEQKSGEAGTDIMYVDALIKIRTAREGE